MRVLITGAVGHIGRRLTRLFSRAHRVTALGHLDLDVTDPKAARDRILFERPDLVINCAVLGVDDCEADPERAQMVNVAGPRALARAVANTGAEMLHFSSNYVFDGRRQDDRPYTVDDAPNPVNVYGKTKLEGERAVTTACPASYIVRTSWVFGPGRESFLSSVHRRLMANERVRAIVDTRASATFVEDLAQRVAEILERKKHGTYQVVNRGACTYYEFAIETVRIVGLAPATAETLIERARERDMRRGAPRPASTPMRCLLSEELGLSPMRRWQEALAGYIKMDIANADRRP